MEVQDVVMEVQDLPAQVPLVSPVGFTMHMAWKPRGFPPPWLWFSAPREGVASSLCSDHL